MFLISAHDRTMLQPIQRTDRLKRSWRVGLGLVVWFGGLTALFGPQCRLLGCVQTPQGPQDSPGQPLAPASEMPPSKPLRFEKRGAIVYCQADEYELKCDVYVPEGPGPFPAVLAIHGGAWRAGSKFMMLRHAWLLAKNGYVVMAINYRHAPRYPFPAQLQDCKHAVRWLRFHAPQYHVDPDRIGVFGYSAGGHLAAMLATTDSGDGFDSIEDPQLAGVDAHVSAAVIGGAPCDFDWIDQDLPVLADWLGGTRRSTPDRYRMAAPLTYASASAAPCYFYHGLDDWLVPIESPSRLNRALQQLEVESSLEPVPGSGHVATFSNLKYLRHGIRFLDRHLKGERPNAPENEKGNEIPWNPDPVTSSRREQGILLATPAPGIK